MKKNEKEIEEIRKANLEKIRKTHKDRLLSVEKPYKNKKDKIAAIIKEAKKKGYTILEVNDNDNDSGNDNEMDKELQMGLCIFKEIDGYELAYNPRWKRGNENK